MEYYAANGGVIEVSNDTLRVLVDEADNADEINEQEAQKAFELAKKMKAEAKDEVSLEYAQNLIDRQSVRLQVATIRRLRRRCVACRSGAKSLYGLPIFIRAKGARSSVVACRVYVAERIVENVAVHIPSLRIGGIGDEIPKRIRRHKPTVLRRIVPRAEIVQPRFGVAFFAGEFVGG